MSKPLRVLHIGDEMNWRGGENQIRLLIEGSAGENIEHHVAYPHGSRGLERFVEWCPVLGFERRKWWPIPVQHLVAYCRDQQIQIIDAQSSGGHSLALRLKRHLPQLRLVVHRRVDNRIKPYWPTRRKYLNKHVDRYVAISGCIRNILIRYGVSGEKISLVRSAIDAAVYADIDRPAAKRELQRELGLYENTVLLGNASAFTHQKGYETLIQALAMLPRDLNFHAVLAGDGPLLDTMKERVAASNLDSAVTFLGHRRDVPRILGGLDILALPSNNEGLGSLLLDAGTAGCALVGSRVGGIPEIIRDQKTGLLCPVGDASALAACLERLIREPALRTRLVTAVQEHIRQHFSLDNMVAGNLQVYRSLLETA
ncbi:glycosyltransferase involved in cell wall biosynthesis [Methylohalomonas lacus]|uniref:Glycosyltransferase involved in cell wall biosynthesis n=1 Tax=Methylohalomonas lacus TaxID=398773 RepID=A0AAE3L115_9GAMM|nr:glycosyltransferase family 4 protein [Methylohalomonas lacus]MCS3903369.1 glycosyltransferase involved in cell wall biosynthesis [Methylohalomonas lacus]